MTKDIAAEPDEIVQSLLEPAPSDEFMFVRIQPSGERKEHRVRVRLLRIDENISALADAQKDAKARGEVAKDYGDIYKESQAVQLLTRAMCRLEKRTRDDGTEWYPPLFVKSEQLRASFTEPEMAQCLNMYEVVKAKYGAIEELSEEDLDSWIERLAGPLGASELSLLDSSRWPVLLLLIARRAADMRKDLGLTLSDLPSSSESDPPSSDSGTGSFTELPAARAASGEHLPEDHMITADEAKSIAKTLLRSDEKPKIDE